MKSIEFKTNINCGNCIKSVSGFLNDVENIEKWEVNTGVPEKILTVNGKNITAEEIIEAVEDAGFDIEKI
ncbi:MAG: heavy-metal-associated domain-containing protein [Saprospiraceae bacterium]